ncbi:unnamed protein product [marine sediment metagenome]|uniref:Uncharacterized protein n=1 Tax=marine sediment metagenome TaxID=412755 RepID=X1TW29_9ZZZZ
MDKVRDSKEVAWKWVNEAEVLSKSACDLIYAKFVSDETVGNTTLYDGEDTNGKPIIRLATAYITNAELAPPQPIYCRRGLYVDTITSGDVLVMWRVRDREPDFAYHSGYAGHLSHQQAQSWRYLPARLPG